jgi:hypothetical protein
MTRCRETLNGRQRELDVSSVIPLPGQIDFSGPRWDWGFEINRLGMTVRGRQSAESRLELLKSLLERDKVLQRDTARIQRGC